MKMEERSHDRADKGTLERKAEKGIDFWKRGSREKLWNTGEPSGSGKVKRLQKFTQGRDKELANPPPNEGDPYREEGSSHWEGGEHITQGG